METWIAELLHLITDLGREKVFVSIVENDSRDGTRQALRDLDVTLRRYNIAHRILLDDETVQPRYRQGDRRQASAGSPCSGAQQWCKMRLPGEHSSGALCVSWAVDLLSA